MKTILLILCLVPLLLYGKTTVSIGPANLIDAPMREIGPTTKYGCSASYTLISGCIGGTTVQRTCIIKPDLSDIPSNATITTALCSVYCYSSIDISFEALQVDQNWVECDVTWNKYDADNDWTTPGGDYSNPDDTLVSAVDTWMVFEVENILQSQLAGDCWGIGLIHKRAGDCTGANDYAGWRHREYETDEAERPRFSITYTVPVSSGQVIIVLE